MIELQASTGWTDERVERLRTMWRDGRSATEIAIDLGGGVSRNAVIGKINRLKLIRVKIIKPETSKAPTPVPIRRVKSVNTAPPPPPPTPPSIAKRDPLNLGLIELASGDCRYVVEGDGAGAKFCAHNVQPGSSYCDYHHVVCHGRGSISERNALKGVRRG